MRKSKKKFDRTKSYGAYKRHRSDYGAYLRSFKLIQIEESFEFLPFVGKLLRLRLMEKITRHYALYSTFSNMVILEKSITFFRI